MKLFSIGVVALGAVLGVTAPASADYLVYAGYADTLRANPSSFPVPWQGSPNTVFVGRGPAFDAGAIMITNTGSSALTINDVTVKGFASGASYDLWGKNTVFPGQSLILTQTKGYNFDTSDEVSGYSPSKPSPFVPNVIITANGIATSYLDTGHVLDTGGFDLANYPNANRGGPSRNESMNWQLIGTTGRGPGIASVPEPTSLTMSVLGAIGLLGFGWRRRKKAA